MTDLCTHSWRLAESDFFRWWEHRGESYTTIFGREKQAKSLFFGRVDKFYCILCTVRKTERFEHCGQDTFGPPEWWSDSLYRLSNPSGNDYRPEEMNEPFAWDQ